MEAQEVNQKVLDGANNVWEGVYVTDAVIVGYGIEESTGDRVVVYGGSDMHPWMYLGLLEWAAKRINGRVGPIYDGQQ